MRPSRKPTSHECDTGAVFEVNDIGAWHAIWCPYFVVMPKLPVDEPGNPRAAVLVEHESDEESCFELAIWLNEGPIEVHFCYAEDIIGFGKAILGKLRGLGEGGAE
jgi:hypothetical protein